MASNINCRMVEEIYPEPKSLVMGRVDSIDRDGVTVTLLEFNNIQGRIMLDFDSTAIQRSVVGRIEPLKVFCVDVSSNYIGLTRAGTTYDQRMKCEQIYNKRKFVHSVLQSVAEEEGIGLEVLYKLTRWPSYEDLPTLHEQQWVKRGIKDKKLRRALFARIVLMRYFSWRIEAPWILDLCYFIQKLASCWSFALIRHLQAYLKIKGKLDNDDYLSFQDFINKVPKEVFTNDEGDVEKLGDVVNVLVREGVLRKEHCPMSDSPLKDEPVKSDEKVFKAPKATVHCYSRDPDYEKIMLRSLKNCPFAATVLWWDSYSGPKVDRILTPTPREQRTFRNTNCKKVPSHVMLMTGKGVDRKGVAFLEFQDSGGDVGHYDRGYIRLGRVPNPVVEYVSFEH